MGLTEGRRRSHLSRAGAVDLELFNTQHLHRLLAEQTLLGDRDGPRYMAALAEKCVGSVLSHGR